MAQVPPDSGPSTEPITVLDLFAGCGGLTEGFHQFRPGAGGWPVFRSVGAVEWDRDAAASYAVNFGKASSRHAYFQPPQIFCRDIVGWRPSWLHDEVDVVVGGPPCQGFSGLNREGVGAERNKLWQEFIRVVVEVQPKVFVIENVDRFVRSPEFADLQARIGNGDLKNYELREPPHTTAGDSKRQRARLYLLNAADYGAMQVRHRAIVIGVRTDVDDLRPIRMRYPMPTHSKARVDNPAQPGGLRIAGPRPAWITVGALFGQTSQMMLSGTKLPANRRCRIVELQSDRRVPVDFEGPFRTSELHFTRNPEPISLARYEAIPPAGNRKDLRGRYVCRFEDGSHVILEKVGAWRDPDGGLDPLGVYRKVVGGKPVPDCIFHVHLEDGNGLLVRERTGRDKAQAFRVLAFQRGSGRRAVLEYLSTDSWDAHDAGAADVMGRMSPIAPSVTIRTEFFKPEKGRYLHPIANRPITHYEAAKIQGFPDDFLWCGSKTAIAKQIGNAVPVPLGVAIAQAIYEYLRPSRP
ncbi:DNA-cytosine methyltransferase [Branchiibius hedensis]|uniref:Cytosine-specific methyltransferase n=1 Tax=Branchiibius hedensis TaxID=672460 RepID=A0A2Y9C1T0_9MICO|nr:DNA cytosine methyltransferase [Branchiibius hedensis]PWJ26061.1 DNA-cytosine methyltransferase [Branchiibius hedensis]SSA34873.1 DNA-methyltransferase (dcm) [Branchiibius hedensis]